MTAHVKRVVIVSLVARGLDRRTDHRRELKCAQLERLEIAAVPCELGIQGFMSVELDTMKYWSVPLIYERGKHVYAPLLRQAT